MLMRGDHAVGQRGRRRRGGAEAAAAERDRRRGRVAGAAGLTMIALTVPLFSDTVPAVAGARRGDRDGRGRGVARARVGDVDRVTTPLVSVAVAVAGVMKPPPVSVTVGAVR